MSARRPTIDDVAALSGVGRTTVSRVLNHGPNVSDAVRQRVQDAVETLGYTVNIQARFLAGGSSRTVLLVCSSDFDSEPNSYYQSALEVGALRACARIGFHLITNNVVQHSPDCADQILEMTRSSRCDGVILTPPFSDDVDLLRKLKARKCAVACISPGAPTHALGLAVGMDDERAAYELAVHLLEQGHRRLGFIKGLEGHVAAEQRYRGIARAVAEFGEAPDAIVTRRGNFTFKSGKDLLPEILDSDPRPTAVICANDDTAAGALFAAHQMGVAVPGDLSIAGFDDTPVSAIVWPPLTTVHQPIQEMSQRAVEFIADALKGGEAAPSAGFETLPHGVVVRGSTAPPRA